VPVVATPQCKLVHPRPERVLDVAKFEVFEGKGLVGK
jgi:hypothetical protein